MSVTLNSVFFGQPAPSSSVTVPSLTNGAVVVACRTNTPATTLTAVTFGGVVLSVVDLGTTGATAGTAFAGGTFAGIAIPSGSQTISVTTTESIAINLSIWYFEGVDQTNPVNAHGYGANTTTTASMTTTATTFQIGYLYNTTISASSPLSHASGGGNPGLTAVDSNGTVSAGAVTNTWTPNPQSYGGFIVGIQAPVLGPAGVKTWDGVTQSTGIKTYQEVAVASVKTWDGIA